MNSIKIRGGTISATDLEYIDRIPNAEKDAFSALFRLYYEQLYYFASRFLKDSQITGNIVQDVM